MNTAYAALTRKSHNPSGGMKALEQLGGIVGVSGPYKGKKYARVPAFLQFANRETPQT